MRSIWSNQSVGFWTTINMKSLSGATIISCFLDLILKNVRSFDGSKMGVYNSIILIIYFHKWNLPKSRTTLRALSANCPISPAYCTVEVLSKVLFTATPKINRIIIWNLCCFNVALWHHLSNIWLFINIYFVWSINLQK